MDQGRVIVDFLIVLNMVLLTIVVIKCILAILTIDVMLLIFLLASWCIVCIKEEGDLDMYVMCTSRNKEVICLAWFFTYQLAVVYLWIVFKLTSTYNIEIIYCPKKVTGRVFAQYPYNSTNE